MHIRPLSVARPPRAQNIEAILDIVLLALTVVERIDQVLGLSIAETLRETIGKVDGEAA
jgi:hypothetical protein